MKVKAFAALVLIIILTVTTGCIAKGQEKEMTNLEFFKDLNFDDGLTVATGVFNRFPMQYATTLGRNGAPQIRPIEFKYEEDGILYFDTVVFYESYAELLEYPYIQLCIGDQETMTYIRLGGKVNFTTDKAVIDRCFKESPVLTSQFGDNRQLVVGYYLTETWLEFASFSKELTNRKYTLLNKYDT